MTIPQFIEEINKHLVIRSLRCRAKVHSKLLKMDFKEVVLSNISYLSVPFFKFDAYKEHYEFIGKDNPYHPIPFPFDDFALAYIAAVLYNHTHENRNFLFPEL